jgi:hypothetical protein
LIIQVGRVFKLLLEVGFEEEEVLAIIEEFPPILGLPVQHQILPVLDYLEVLMFFIFFIFFIFYFSAV